MADRDREAAVDLASEFFVDFGPNDERWHDLFKDRMSAIVAKARAEGAASERAAATAACAAECNQRAAKYTATAIDLEKLGHVGTGEEVRLEARMARECESAIRALSPEGWVGVRREDAELAVSGLLLMSAKWEFCEEEPLPIAAKAAEDAADRIRAALDAAKEG